MVEKLAELQTKIKSNPNDIESKVLYSKSLYNLILDLSEQGNNEEAIKYIEKIEQFARENIGNKDILIYYGQAILNALPIFLGRATSIAIKERINILREISLESNEIALLEILSMTLVNSIYDFSLSNQTASIHEFCMELIDLARNYPKNRRIQSASAKGMMNATMYFLQKEDKDVAKDYFNRLIKIIDANPKEEMVDSKRLLDLKKLFQN